jgi:Kef-type K+ transport system membrane component KefB
MTMTSLFKKRRIPSYLIIALGIFFLFSFIPSFITAQNDTGKTMPDTEMHSEEGATHQTSSEGEHVEHVVVAGEVTEKPIIRVLFELILFIVVAKLGGELMERIHQPAVLGELILGVVIGNLVLLGIDYFEFLKQDHFIEILAEIGVIILLFEVGLETNLREMLTVGTTAFLVAFLGVVTPFILGWGVGALFLPEAGTYVHIFIGATLTATSVGITARVIKDIRKLQTREAKIILGAAVIDDIMGLIVLAIVTGLITAADAGTGIDSLEVLWIVVKALAFVTLALIVGNKVMPSIFLAALNMKGQGILLAVALIVCFGLAMTAELIGLAGIVGAFAAGVIMERVHYRGFMDRGEHSLEDLITPIASFLVPIFFVHMGLMVNISTFGNLNDLVFAGILTVAAIIGKQACSFGVFKKDINKLSIGIGMIPRGEVGLIFAKIGQGLTIGGVAVISSATYSAVIIMVIVTTLVTPPILKRSLLKKSKDFYMAEES